MAFINNWGTKLEGELATGTGLALHVPVGHKARLSGDTYLLTLSDGEDDGAIEIIEYDGTQDTITARALEGTSERAWPADTVIYAALTAGQLTGILVAIQQLDARVASLQQQVDECCQGGSSGGLADQNGNTLIDQNGNILEV